MPNAVAHSAAAAAIRRLTIRHPRNTVPRWSCTLERRTQLFQLFAVPCGTCLPYPRPIGCLLLPHLANPLPRPRFAPYQRFAAMQAPELYRKGTGGANICRYGTAAGTALEASVCARCRRQGRLSKPGDLPLQAPRSSRQNGSGCGSPHNHSRALTPTEPCHLQDSCSVSQLPCYRRTTGFRDMLSPRCCRTRPCPRRANPELWFCNVRKHFLEWTAAANTTGGTMDVATQVGAVGQGTAWLRGADPCHLPRPTPI